VIAGNSPFDRYYFGHDKKAMSPAAQRGFRLFTDPEKGNCAVCHTIGKADAMFTDHKFHNLGIGADTRGNLNDLGRYTVTKEDKDKGCFKTPTLRNLANRGPYMHDGSFPHREGRAGALHWRGEYERSSGQANQGARFPHV
jgi:cytochrome c peroxidase